MASRARTLHTIYGQYRTAAAVSRAANADYIPLNGDRNINAVHPIPIDWLDEELLPSERDQVREHVASLLSSQRRQVPSFVEALQGTMENLNTIRNRGTATRSIPARRSGGETIDRLADDFDTLTMGQAHGVISPSRNVRFAETVRTDRVSRDPAIPGPYSPQPSSPTPRSIMRSPGHSRANSAEAILSHGALTPRDARVPSPTDGYSEELAALDVQLDEIYAALNSQRRIEDNGSLEQRFDSLAQARSMIRRLRGLHRLNQIDIDTARAAVQSVMTSTGRNDTQRAAVTNADSRPERMGRGLPHRTHEMRRPRPVSGSFSSIEERLRLATVQHDQRLFAHTNGMFPVWSSPPVDPQYGDGIQRPDGTIYCWGPMGGWLMYHSRDGAYFCE
ncbi:hypothetical protein J4E83_008978 [Alternaria metachromatica]|uniref:uncharacterized protein n=1 Tax=Alternaria metachromatica TaxID=283354 RepID=UPI0020C4376E|nr:uncharacterized protein J4E83_008978 [Alternaria metachromatica]KAI4608939.1 hypothetical protein J4E83_008978 [Alternaria metachromatica]